MKKICLSLLLLLAAVQLTAQKRTTADTKGAERGSESLAVEVVQPEMPKVGKVRIALDAAYSYRTAKAADPSVDRQMKGWRSGIAYGANVHGFIGYGFGIGAKATGRNYSYSGHGISDVVNTFYVGPSVMYRLFNRSKNVAMIVGYSLGYMHFGEKTAYDGDTVGYKGGALGTSMEFGADFRLSGKLFLGITMNIFSGNVKIEGFSEREGLQAIEIGGGLRF